MPITPFHFGPPTILKTVTPASFSFVSFGFTQVIIDMEPLVHMARGAWPIHRFFHTYLGATVVALAVVLFCAKPGEALLRLWNSRLSDSQKRWLAIDPCIPARAAVIGALFGAWSHVLLDSIMHDDMRPWFPLSDGNGLLHVISIDQLHLVCLILGIAGMAALTGRLVTHKKRQTR